MDVALIVVAAAFALVNGANTGGTMLSLNLTVHALRPVTGILVMTLGVVLAPTSSSGRGRGAGSGRCSPWSPASSWSGR